MTQFDPNEHFAREEARLVDLRPDLADRDILSAKLDAGRRAIIARGARPETVQSFWHHQDALAAIKLAEEDEAREVQEREAKAARERQESEQRKRSEAAKEAARTKARKENMIQAGRLRNDYDRADALLSIIEDER